jgi:hypothetical protein
MLFHMTPPGAPQFLLIHATPPSRPPKRGRSRVLSYLLTAHYSLLTWRVANRLLAWANGSRFSLRCEVRKCAKS